MKIIDAIKVDNKLYFLSPDLAGLFQYDFISEKSSILCRFDGYKLFNDSVCSHMIRYNSYIVISPGKGSTFYVFDMDSCDIREVRFEDDMYSDYRTGQKDKFFYSCIIGPDVFFVGYNVLEIVKIDPVLATGKVFILNSFEEFNGLNASRMAIEGCVDGKNIIIPFSDIQKIISFDTEGERFSDIKNSFDFNPLGMNKINEYYYFYSLLGTDIAKTYLPSSATDRNVLMHYEEFDIPKTLKSICRSVQLHDGLYIIPFRGYYILKIDEKDNTIKQVCNVQDVMIEKAFMAGGKLDDHTLWAFPHEKDVLVTYNEITNERIDHSIPKADLTQAVERKDLEECLITESEGFMDLNDFMDIILTE